MMERVDRGQQATGAREKILLSAHELFYRHGIRATGIDKIIAQARVTKVTFYRHFPSKNDLILAYLEYRHTRWLNRFSQSIKQHHADGRSPADALANAMADWWENPDFRGCAFLNATAEMGEALPEIMPVTRAHKAAVADVLAHTWGIEDRTLIAMLVVALDGAIMHAQMGVDVLTVKQQLRAIVAAMIGE
ncbi:TetR/AcrR family transcriptional regulator [Kluyvera cryocrescens]|uniref:TetR/AcrR family transcriptional regulator n=1 Tax=Kluyvera cryocrescens TaxID=580 RepID=UPI000D9CA20C|nr:TetR/AcrR family transcriptional regulator [Kluyvera cryocrescens]MEB7556907.1 TetR/AcrR family transcriptional regulator [Kluyvera cryocrescens]SQC35608.1 DNA-binding transcriptional repressor AcrR [Kluyvera cryocrescens]